MNRSAPTTHHLALPIMVACVGIALFSTMDVFMKLSTLAVGVFSAVFWRCVIAVVISTPVYVAQKGRIPRGRALKLHVTRAAFASAMTMLFFWGLARIPMAEAIAISFISPLIALYLAAAVLKERVSKTSIIATALSLAGMGVILSGKFSGDYPPDAVWGVCAILASAFFYAWNLIFQRMLAQEADAVEFTYWQSVFMVMFLLPFALAFLKLPESLTFLHITAAALLSLVSLFALGWGYARAEAQTLAPTEYSGFVWASLWGWLVFGEQLTLPTIFGATLIVSGCVLVVRRRPEIAAAHTEQTAT